MPVLYLTEQGATLRKEGELFLVTKEGRELHKIPAVKVEQVVVLGNIGLTTPVINHLLEQGIDCVFCNSHGKYHGRLLSTESRFGLLRQQQLRAVDEGPRRLSIARDILRGKLLNQRTFIMRQHRGHPLPSLERAIAGLENAVEGLEACSDVNSLHGVV